MQRDKKKSICQSCNQPKKKLFSNSLCSNCFVNSIENRTSKSLRGKLEPNQKVYSQSKLCVEVIGRIRHVPLEIVDSKKLLPGENAIKLLPFTADHVASLKFSGFVNQSDNNIGEISKNSVFARVFLFEAVSLFEMQEYCKIRKLSSKDLRQASNEFSPIIAKLSEKHHEIPFTLSRNISVLNKILDESSGNKSNSDKK